MNRLSLNSKPYSWPIFGRVAEWTLTILIIAFSTQNADGQPFSVTAALGLEYFNAPSISRYLNYELPGSITPGTYTTAVQFQFSGQYRLATDWEIGIEYAYITRSVSQSYGLSALQVNYSYSLPTITLRRVITGEGYLIRFGGGIGYHFGTLSASSIYSTQLTDYSAKGLGLKADAAFDTKLGDNFYARVLAEARGEFVGNLKSKNGQTLTYGSTPQDHSVDMYFSGVGVSFGLVYYF